MSEAIKQETVPGHDYAYNTPLEDLDVSNPHLWPSEEMWPVFERLRDEDPCIIARMAGLQKAHMKWMSPSAHIGR